MNKLRIFILLSIVVFGIGPWFIIPALTEQPMNDTSKLLLISCQILILAPLCIALIFIRLRQLIKHIKKRTENKDETT